MIVFTNSSRCHETTRVMARCKILLEMKTGARNATVHILDLWIEMHKIHKFVNRKALAFGKAQ